MKYGVYIFLLSFFLTACFIIIRQPDAPKLAIAVLDGPRIKREAKPFVELLTFRGLQHKKAYQDIFQEESKLRTLYHQIRTSLDPSSIINEKKKILEQRRFSLEKKVQTLRVKLHEKISRRARMLENEMNKIIKNIVKKNHLMLVLNTQLSDKRVVLYTDSTLDITNQVMKELNQLSLPPIND